MTATNEFPEQQHANACPIHLVLVEPEIPQNTGNIARSCLATGATLHLIKPYGFFTSDRHLKRAGMDYWPEVNRVEHRSLEDFLNRHGDDPLVLLSKKGAKLYTEMPSSGPVFLLFGSESKGLPSELVRRYEEQIYRLPMQEGIRSLNLASAATAVLYEALRLRNFPGLSYQP